MRSKFKQALCSCGTLLVFAASFALHAQQEPKAGKRTLIRAGHLLDVKTGKLSDAQTIVVVGDSIQSIAATSSLMQQPGDEVIDLGGATVLPGLMDVHTHLTMNPDFDPFREVTSTNAKEAINGVVNARKTLMAGFTTARNVGAGGFVDVDLRDAINAGQVAGPHLLVSGPALGITGGHCDDNLLPAQYHHSSEGVADGIAEVQHKVRDDIKYGADVIKICATGGVLSKGDDPQASQYTLEEMQAIVADAHRLGRKVAAHAHGAQGILWASEAGVDSIEHGTMLDEEGAELMEQHHTWLVPTLYCFQHDMETGLSKGRDPDSFAKGKEIMAAQGPAFKLALAHHIRIAYGVDDDDVDESVSKEFGALVRGGMTTLGALQAATINAATMLEKDKDVGTIEPGHFADIVAVQGDPLSDITVMEHVAFVMQGGRIIKDPAHPDRNPVVHLK